MRDLVISTIEKNFENGLNEIGRHLCCTLEQANPIIVTLYAINNGAPELLVPWLKSLSNEQLLGVLESQHCERYR